MSKVTLLWMPYPNKPMKRLSVRKHFVYAIIGGFVFFLGLTFILGILTARFWIQSSQYAFENTRLVALLSQKEAENKSLVEEIQAVQAQENRIRRFLGLNDKVSNESRANQGGSGRSFPAPNGTESAPCHLNEGSEPVELSFATSIINLRERFGEIVAHITERQDEANRTPTILPVKGTDVWVPSHFGWRVNPITGAGQEFHNGLDIAGPLNAPVIAPAYGVVIDAGRDAGLGNFVRLGHSSTLFTLYGHLADIAVRRGERIHRGQVIGHMGDTGRSTGVHVHYSVIRDNRFVNPIEYIWDHNPGLSASISTPHEDS